MKRLLYLCAGLLSALLISACDADAIKNSIGIHRPDGSGRDPLPSKDTVVIEPSATLYICGVSELPNSSKLLCLLQNDKVLLQFQCDDQNRISADPDSHFLIGDRLYTTWQGEGKTVIRLNGDVLHTFNEEEYIKDILLLDDELWTLSKNTSDDGFKLRRDGEVVFARPEGDIGELYEDQGNICFCYFSTAAKKKTLHLVRNGNELTLDASKNYNLLDAKLRNGALWYLEHGETKCTLHSARDNNHSGPIPQGMLIQNGEIIPCGDGVVGIIRAKTPPQPIIDKLGTNFDYILTPKSLLTKNDALISYYYGETGTLWRVAMEKKSKKTSICNLNDNESFSISDMSIYGKRCITSFDGKIYVALSDPTCTSPSLIWSENGQKNSRFTGRITGISLVPER